MTITKADASITVTPYNVTYDDTSHTATGEARGVQGELLSGLDLGSTIHTNAGTYAADPWYFTDVTGNYNHAGGIMDNFIAKADQTITWTDPAAITYGTALDGTQLNATVAGVAGGSAPGVLTYNPATGTVLQAGPDQDLTVIAAATGNHKQASKTVQIDVHQKGLTVTTANTSKTYGDANPGFTVSYSGFVNGEDQSDLSGTLDFSTTATQFSDVGG